MEHLFENRKRIGEKRKSESEQGRVDGLCL